MSDNKPAHGTIFWNELMTRDTGVAGEFYSRLLGWKATDSGMPGMTYTIFKSGEKRLAGMMTMPKEIPAQVPPHWMTYIAVDDVDASARQVVKLGGAIIHGPQDVPTVGRFCIIQDPTGAVISLITMI